jgi:hypothetical protein
MLTSMSVIGYGSTYKSYMTQVILIFLLLGAMIALQDQTSQIMTNLSAKSVYMTKRYSKINKVPHIVLLGKMNHTSMMDFLHEYMHTDHGEDARHCVIMMNHRPSPTTIRELNQGPPWKFYLQGDPHTKKELTRCRLDEAEAVIILSDKLAYDGALADTETILQALVIKNEFKRKNGPNT